MLKFRHLALTQLEDRAVPAAGLFADNRVLVTVAAPARTGQPVAEWLAPVVGSAPIVRVAADTYELTLAPGTTVHQTLERLASVPGIHAQPDYLIAPQAVVPADPQLAAQWAHTTISSRAAWGVTTGTGQTIVAVIDTGLDVSHPDMARNLWVNPREIAGDGLDNDGNGFIDDIHGVDFTRDTNNPFDESGHGTHVAGAIGAVGNNGIGISGVAWTTRIMPLKFMNPLGGYTSDAVRAVDYALANGARVLNASWGGPVADPALEAAIGRVRAAGAVFVAGAGNDGRNTETVPFYPAHYARSWPHVVSVAATDSADRLAPYSNTGAQTVTLAAPGSNILSTLPNGRYGALSGTSMAAAQVSGALALLWDRNPGWSADQVVAKLKSSVDVLPQLVGQVATGGRLNVGRLLDAPPAVPPAPPPAPVVPPAPPENGLGTTVTQAAFGGARAGQFDRITVTFSRPVEPALLAQAIEVSGPAGALRVSAVIPAAGNTRFTLMLSRAQTAAGTYTFTLNATRTTAGAVVPPYSLTQALGATDRVRFTAVAVPPVVQPGRTTRLEIRVTEAIPASAVVLDLGLTHTNPQTLQVRLTAPDGRREIVFNRGPMLPATGAFHAATLNGASALGVWVVELFDFAPTGRGGSLQHAALSLSGVRPTAWLEAVSLGRD